MRNLNLKFISVIIFAITFLIGGFFVNMETVFADASITLESLPQTIQVNSMSSLINLHLDRNEILTGGQHFFLTTNESGTGWYFTSANCSTPLSSNNRIGIASDDSNKHFCYFSTHSGNFTITATGDETNSLVTTQTITVNAPAGPTDSAVPATASYDKFVDTTLDIAITLNGNTLTSIANGATTLTDTVDYNLSESTVTLTSAYMQAQSVGATTLDFIFSAGADDSIVITVSDSTPVTHTLTYITGTHGSITGILSQTVDQGAGGSEVTAIADSGYHFTSWSDGVLTASRTDIDIQGDISVTANFAINTHTLTYTAGANGTITGITSQTVDYGSSGSAVTAVANSGYHFVDWSDGGLTAERTDTNVQVDKSVNANFSITSSHSSSGSYARPVVKAPVVNTTPVVGKVLGTEKFNFTRFIKFKMGSYRVRLQGNEVTELQKLLNTLGYTTLIVDGKFGPKTKGAVIKFQIANGLKDDGVVGPLTRAVLNK